MDIISALIICVLLAYLIVQDQLARRERQRLVEAFLAKNLKEVSDLEYTRKLKPAKEEPSQDLVIASEADDNVFDKMIKTVNGNK